MTNERPKLRPVDVQWRTHRGQPMIVLNDPLRLGGRVLLVPQAAGPLLALMDGTRDVDALLMGFLQYTGAVLPREHIEGLISNLDEGLLLDNERSRAARSAVIDAYRQAPYRKPFIAGRGYSADAGELRATLDEYCRQAAVPERALLGGVAGVISPHIDFARGWQTYAHIWQPIKEAVLEAELVVLLGTDHSGTAGSITLTRQRYSTPWGILPTDEELVGKLAGVLGEEAAFREEHHHLGEHSIELASVWLHYMAAGEPKRVLPVLCGHHGALLVPDNPNAARAWEAIHVLGEAASKRRTLIVAAGDLSHVGPAFGDGEAYDAAAKARIRALDEGYLQAACSGQSEAMKKHLLANGDPTRICGCAPIHFMVHMLRGATGQVLHYDQCPADESFGSLVSIAGVVYS